MVAATLSAVTLLISERVTIVAWQTLVAERSSGVVDTLETHSCGPIAVGHGVLVDVAVAVASLARHRGVTAAFGVPKVAIRANIASGTGITHGALKADHGVVGQLDTGTALEAIAGRTVVGCALQGVAIVTLPATLALTARSVVATNALTSFRVTDLGVVVAVAGDAGGKGSPIWGVMTEPRGARLAVLSHVALRAGTHLHPARRHAEHAAASSV